MIDYPVPNGESTLERIHGNRFFDRNDKELVNSGGSFDPVAVEHPILTEKAVVYTWPVANSLHANLLRLPIGGRFHRNLRSCSHAFHHRLSIFICHTAPGSRER